MENKEKSFEDLLNELSAIVKELESGTLSLEDSVARYQQGISLSVECKKRLDEARNVVVTKMTENAEELFK
jgi:exodeoxyribonuclease VII small subunit